MNQPPPNTLWPPPPAAPHRPPQRSNRATGLGIAATTLVIIGTLTAALLAPPPDPEPAAPTTTPTTTAPTTTTTTQPAATERQFDPSVDEATRNELLSTDCAHLTERAHDWTAYHETLIEAEKADGIAHRERIRQQALDTISAYSARLEQLGC